MYSVSTDWLLSSELIRRCDSPCVTFFWLDISVDNSLCRFATPLHQACAASAPQTNQTTHPMISQPPQPPPMTSQSPRPPPTILSEQNNLVAVVAKKRRRSNLPADKHFFSPRFFSSDCCNEIKRSTSTTNRSLDGTLRPKLKCSKCTKTHKKWTVIPDYRVPLCLAELLEPIAKLKLTPSDELCLRRRLQVFTQQE